MSVRQLATALEVARLASLLVTRNPQRATRNGIKLPVGVTPVPIPNTVVKPSCADDTAGVTLWESGSLPGVIKRKPLQGKLWRGFLLIQPFGPPAHPAGSRPDHPPLPSDIRPDLFWRCPVTDSLRKGKKAEECDRRHAAHQRLLSSRRKNPR